MSIVGGLRPTLCMAPTMRSFDSNSYRFLMRSAVSAKSPRFPLCTDEVVWTECD